MADDQDLEWLSDYVLSFLKSPSWVAPIAHFVDEQCIIFEDQEENKLEYTVCHQEFAQLIDNLLAAHLLELDITNEQFEQFCQTGLSTHPTLHRVLVEQLLAVDDFLIFKAMMTARNMDLYREAQRIVDAGIDDDDFQETTVVDEEDVIGGITDMAVKEVAMVADEWKLYEDQLFQALDESQKADDELARERQKEEEELERALALSLQTEEEKMPSEVAAQASSDAPPPPGPPPPTEVDSASAAASSSPAGPSLTAASLGPLRPVLPRVMRVAPMTGSRPGTAATISPEHERARADVAALSAPAIDEAGAPPPPPPPPQVQRGPSEADRKARAEHLQRQRQLLVEKRNKERQRQLEASLAGGNARVARAVDAAAGRSNATGQNLVAELTAASSAPGADTGNAAAAAQMRQALAAQLKQTLRTPV